MPASLALFGSLMVVVSGQIDALRTEVSAA
jgi:hypothetical protein